MQAAIAMYAVAMAAFMITGAKLADRWGRRRTFMFGTAVYGIGSGITALSPSLASLVIGWSLIEGLGSAFAQPALLTLATLNFIGVVSLLAFLLAFRLKTPTPEYESEASNGFAPEVCGDSRDGAVWYRSPNTFNGGFSEAGRLQRVRTGVWHWDRFAR
jgi:Major Facilitator Superfamily